MSCDLRVTYEEEKQERISRGGSDERKVKERDTSRLIITPGASYNFNRNIRGGLSGSYELSTDNTNNVKMNILRMDVWIEFIF